MTLADRFEQEIEVRGHLIDSMILTRIFDSIMDMQGDFQVLEFTVGKKKGDPSYARLLVKGRSRAHLESILEQVYREGAQPVSVQEARLEPAPRDMVMPDDFYSTTNNATQVYHGGQWIEVQNMMMDKCIVVDTRRRTAECRMVRDIIKGDMVVVGERGVKIIPLERPREGARSREKRCCTRTIHDPAEVVRRAGSRQPRLKEMSEQKTHRACLPARHRQIRFSEDAANIQR